MECPVENTFIHSQIFLADVHIEWNLHRDVTPLHYACTSIVRKNKVGVNMELFP
jgi:hypothetical protein